MRLKFIKPKKVVYDKIKLQKWSYTEAVHLLVKHGVYSDYSSANTCLKEKAKKRYDSFKNSRYPKKLK